MNTKYKIMFAIGLLVIFFAPISLSRFVHSDWISSYPSLNTSQAGNMVKIGQATSAQVLNLQALSPLASLVKTRAVQSSLSMISGVYQQLTDGDGNQWVLGGTYTLPSGETIPGSLIVLGGVATLETGSTVAGDVVILGGNLYLDGTVEGNIISLGGMVELGANAVVQNDLNVLGAQVSRDPGAKIEGSENYGFEGPFNISIPGSISLPWGGTIPDLSIQVNPYWSVARLFFSSLLWGVFAALLVLFLRKPIERVGHAAASQPVVTIMLGLITLILAPILMILFAITIIGIPVSLLLILGLVVTWAYGVIAIGAETGRRLGLFFKRSWSVPITAALGTFLLTLIVNGVNLLLPCCFDWILPLFVGMLGIGSILITRYGTRDYPTQAPSTILPVDTNQPIPPAE